MQIHLPAKLMLWVRVIGTLFRFSVHTHLWNSLMYFLWKSIWLKCSLTGNRKILHSHTQLKALQKNQPKSFHTSDAILIYKAEIAPLIYPHETNYSCEMLLYTHTSKMPFEILFSKTEILTPMPTAEMLSSHLWNPSRCITEMPSEKK